jgi:hypothetical protein
VTKEKSMIAFKFFGFFVLALAILSSQATSRDQDLAKRVQHPFIVQSTKPATGTYLFLKQ